MSGSSFPIILWGVIFIAAALWVGDRFFKPRKALGGLFQLGRSFFPVLLCAGLFRSFVGELYFISSESMQPSLQVGDYIWVNKLAYGLKVPLTEQPIVFKQVPSRGDVVVFRPPSKASGHFIKRIVALPGDHVRYDFHLHNLYINGVQVQYESASGPSKGYFIEAQGKVNYPVIRQRLNQPIHSDKIYQGLPSQGAIVPSGHYFVLGDHRNESEDSRVWGMLKAQSIIGKAVWSWGNGVNSEMEHQQQSMIFPLKWL